MKNIHFNINPIFLIALLFLINGCEKKTPPLPQTQQPQIVCPRGLSFTECNNSSALHGQIMMHNMTNKSYEVTVYTHDGSISNEVYHLMPGSGWTFTGILQGQRMIIAKPTLDGEPYESHCMVVGGMQHIMNITHFGIVQVETESHM